MTTKKSLKKSLRQSEQKYLRNKKVKISIKKASKKLKVNSKVDITSAIKIIAKAASKGIIHKKNASNKISKIMLKHNLGY
jgi:small subunit ribosomal protein S20